MFSASSKMSSLWKIPVPHVTALLHVWWSECLKWVTDRPALQHDLMSRDLNLVQFVLHHLAVSGPLDGSISTVLGPSEAVTVETAQKGVGPAESVHVPPDLWDLWGDPNFLQAGQTAPQQQYSQCPKTQAMLRALAAEGLLQPTTDPPNAQVFLKYNSPEKATMIVNTSKFNGQCAFKARKFCLPSLEGLALLLRQSNNKAWARKLDLKYCYWSVHVPPQLLNSVRIGAGGYRYCTVRVPFGWHQARGLVQHLISLVLATVPLDTVVVIQYFDDILFVSKDRP